MPRYPDNIEQSNKYYDDYYEYKHLILPEAIYKKLGKERKLLTKDDWEKLGIELTNGWEHYLIYENEPHILLFRRPIGTDPNTGEAPLNVKNKFPKYIEEKEKNLAITSEYSLE